MQHAFRILTKQNRKINGLNLETVKTDGISNGYDLILQRKGRRVATWTLAIHNVLESKTWKTMSSSGQLRRAHSRHNNPLFTTEELMALPLTGPYAGQWRDDSEIVNNKDLLIIAQASSQQET